MSDPETFALATRLHVVIRRATGRVTDVDWMTHNLEYAQEVIRLARQQNKADILALADKFEHAVLSMRPARRADPALRRPSEAAQPTPAQPGDGSAQGPAAPQVDADSPPRYVGRLR